MRKCKVILILMLTIICMSCQNVAKHKNSGQEHIIQPKKSSVLDKISFDLSSHKDKFKFGHLDLFSMDSVTWDERVNYYHKLTEGEYFSVYQDTFEEYYGGHEYSIDLDFFYSLQNRNTEFQEITVLWQKEGVYCDGITYLIFDKNGKLIDNFPVAGSCSDGGYFDNEYGFFLNDSTYKLIIEDNYKTEDIDEAIIMTKTEKIFTITKQGKVKMADKTISIDTLINI